MKTTIEILEKVNEITRESFTKVVKIRSNAGNCFLIAALNNGDSIYGSFSSNAVYYIANNGDRYGFRN